MRPAFLWALVLLSGWMGGCASYSSALRPVEQALAAGRPAEALQRLEHNHGRGADAVLYQLQKGMLLRLAGDYAGSNAALEAAKRGMEALYGVSVSEQAEAVTLNEGLIAYKGAPYEQILVHAYMALNFLALDEPDAARVELRQADVKMTTVGGEAYGELGFMRYLSGLIYESLGEADSAYIDYRKAYEYYRDNRAGLSPPRALEEDLLRLAAAQGRDEDLAEYRHLFGEPRPPAPPGPDEGEAVVLVHCNLVPAKREDLAAVFDPKRGQFITIALPYYPEYVDPVGGVEVSAEGREARAEQVEDVAAQARLALEAQMRAITARALARAVVKTQLSREARKNNDLAGALVNLAGLLTERADTRSWSTLPAAIWLARLRLPAGEQRLEIHIRGRRGELLASLEQPVTVEAGGRRFVSTRWIMPMAGGRQ